MKVIVFDKKTTKDNFTNYGYGKLHLISECKIAEELNGIYDVELTVYLSDPRAKYLVKFNILWVEGQLFRIYNTVKNDKDNTVKLYAKHIFYDLEYDFIEYEGFNSGTVDEYLSKIKLREVGKNFDIYPSDVLTKNNGEFIKINGAQAVFNVLKIWKEAELKRDNFKISVQDSVGKDNGVTFTYKKLEAIEITEDTDNVVTRLYPLGKDGITLKEKYVNIPTWDSEEYPPYPITKEVSFEKCESEGELREVARKEAEKLGLANVNIKINVSDLKNTSLYKDIPLLMDVNIGDIVTIKHSKLNCRVKVKCIKREIELVTGHTVLEFGQPLQNFFESVDNSNVKVDVDLEQMKDGMYYYSNGLDVNLSSSFSSVAFINFGTNTNANLTVHFSSTIECTVTGLIEVKMLVDNKEMNFTPKQTCCIGQNLISYSFPLIAMEKDKSHSIDFQLKCENTAKIKAEQLQIILQGQNLSGGLSAEVPHAEVIQKINYLAPDITGITMGGITQLQVPIPANVVQNIAFNNIGLTGVTGNALVDVKQLGFELVWDKDFYRENLTYNFNSGTGLSRKIEEVSDAGTVIKNEADFIVTRCNLPDRSIYYVVEEGELIK